MDIWIIRNGEKSGPFPDYEIRHKIDAGELSRDVPAWHDGLDRWRPLAEISLFENDFAAAPPPPAPAVEDSPYAPPVLPPPPPEKPAILRRFWARWLDLHLYAAVWWLAMWAGRRDIEAVLMNPWIMVPYFIPWFILETLLIHRFATTPGKALLGLRVLNADGSRLDLASSTRRSLRVLVAGIGFGWGFIAILCQGLSLYTTKRLGMPLWDYLGQHRVVATPVHPLRLVFAIVLLVAAVRLQIAVTFPYTYKNALETFPELKSHPLREAFEKDLPWQLPPRHKSSRPS